MQRYRQKKTAIEDKKYIITAHIAILVAVLGSSEPFDDVGVSPWVMVIALGVLLLCYFIFCVIKLKYIPKFHILIAFYDFLVWIMALFTADHWSNITGWDRLIYLIYPYITGIFFVCLLVMNLLVHIIRRVRAKKMQI